MQIGVCCHAYSSGVEVASARLAQSVEHQTLNLRVVGSSPTLGEDFLHERKVNLGVKCRFYRDLNSDRWIQSPEC